MWPTDYFIKCGVFQGNTFLGPRASGLVTSCFASFWPNWIFPRTGFSPMTGVNNFHKDTCLVIIVKLIRVDVTVSNINVTH